MSDTYELQRKGEFPHTYLNLGCGGHRPQHEGPYGVWWNLDTLRTFLKEGTPERTNLDAEPRYVECDLLKQSIPFRDGYFDGILWQHGPEHFTCHECIDVLMSCRRVLRTGGVIVVSAPDVRYFRVNHGDDDVQNAPAIFGEPISEPEHKTFFSYALWHKEHKQILNVDGLWAILRRAGFAHQNIWERAWDKCPDEIKRQLNRPKFSAALLAIK